jgi:uncharacterized delta-60 repeat protein
MLGGVVPSASAQAAAGDLDLTFSGDGKQTTGFRSGSNGEAKAVAVQPDGKVVAVGSGFGSPHGHLDLALSRYNPNGSLDLSFSEDGRQTIDFGDDDEATGVALQANGKIVVVGHAGSSYGDFRLARYNPNGSLDTSFSGDGKQTTQFGGAGAGATGVAIQENGKIVVVGEARSGSGSAPEDFALARYNSNGTLDTTFSSDGKQTTDFATAADGAMGVAVQGDGKIVAVGVARGGGIDFGVTRYKPNGALDTSFSGDGRQRTDFGGTDEANAVEIQANGKILAAGFTHAGGGDFALARYNPNGALDTSFSGDGRQKTDFGGTFEEANGVALQPDGKIVAVGEADGDFAVGRYMPNGTLDSGFSGDGKQGTDFGGFDPATGVAVRGNGKIVAVGGRNVSGTSNFALASYNPNGTLDTSFSGDGKQTTEFRFGTDDAANGVALQGDGKLIVVGSGFILTRYNPDGSLDPTLSGDGKQTTDFGGFGQDATAVAIQDDGKIVVVGSFDGPMLFAEFAIARFNPDGSLDTTFSGDGRQAVGFVGHDEAHGVAIQADGKIVVVGSGYDTVTGDSAGALARYNPDGSLDTTFSDDGKLTTDFGAWNGVAIQDDDKIVTVGGADGGASFDLAIARYASDGSLDTSFSGDGKQTTDFGGDEGASGVALQTDGRIVAVGRAGASGARDFALARYDANGSLDTTFSDDGKQTTDFGFGADDAANDIALQGDGKILAVGLATGGGTGSDFALARYDESGLLDPSFSGDGKRRTNFGGDDEGNGVALQADGTIVAVGRGLGADGTSDFALARYLGG